MTEKEKEQTLQRILKSIVNFNNNELEFYKDFLKYQDNFGLNIIEEDKRIVLKTYLRKDVN